MVARRSVLALVVLALTACNTPPEETCAALGLVWDPARAGCYCPPGMVGIDDVCMTLDAGREMARDASPDAHLADGGRGCAPEARPTLVSPANGALTGSVVGSITSRSLRPLFRWQSVSSDTCTPSSYQVVVDDSCSVDDRESCAFPSPEASLEGIADTAARPMTDLPVSRTAPVGTRYYWRVRACGPGGCGPWSETRFVEVGRAMNDINGDGLSDVIVGASMQDAGAADEGSVFVYYGNASGLSSAPTATRDNPANQANALFGHSVAFAGDVNGDGYNDIVVGAYSQDGSVPDQGAAFVYHGGVSGLSATPITVLANPADQPGAFGIAVAGAGDVNADGYADVIVGASAQDGASTDEGAAFVYYGGPTGLAVAPAISLENPTHQPDAYFGVSVSTAGDVNGDGYSDVVVGAYSQSSGALQEGNAFVYYGSRTGLSPVAALTLDNPENQAMGGFGRSVANAGDVNGDGFGDVIVGAHRQSAGSAQEGSAFVYHGSAAGLGASPTTVLDNPAGTRSGYFGSSVAGAGDVNGDGYSDVVVGAQGQSQAFVYHGSATGIPTRPGVELADTMSSTSFGSAAALGDVNGDGYSDVVVGAPGRDAGATDEGGASVFHGGPAGAVVTPASSLDNPANQAGGRFGVSVASSEIGDRHSCYRGA